MVNVNKQRARVFLFVSVAKNVLIYTLCYYVSQVTFYITKIYRAYIYTPVLYIVMTYILNYEEYELYNKKLNFISNVSDFFCVKKGLFPALKESMFFLK